MKSKWAEAMAGLVVAGAILIAASHSRGQYSPSGSAIQSPSGSRLGGFGEGPDADPGFAEKRLRALNADRHKSMVSDANKLVKLARQLDAEIASNPTNELTPEELRKFAEVEKLARNVKTKMAQSFGGGPQYRPVPVPMAGPGLQ